MLRCEVTLVERDIESFSSSFLAKQREDEDETQATLPVMLPSKPRDCFRFSFSPSCRSHEAI